MHTYKILREFVDYVSDHTKSCCLYLQKKNIFDRNYNVKSNWKRELSRVKLSSPYKKDCEVFIPTESDRFLSCEQLFQ